MVNSKWQLLHLDLALVTQRSHLLGDLHLLRKIKDSGGRHLRVDDRGAVLLVAREGIPGGVNVSEHVGVIGRRSSSGPRTLGHRSQRQGEREEAHCKEQSELL